jgi:hypothetical protein
MNQRQHRHELQVLGFAVHRMLVQNHNLELHRTKAQQLLPRSSELIHSLALSHNSALKLAQIRSLELVQEQTRNLALVDVAPR